MPGIDLLTGSMLLGATVAGALIAWALESRRSKRHLQELKSSWITRLEESEERVESQQAEMASLQDTLDAERAEAEKVLAASRLVRQEYNAARDKFVVMQRELDSLAAERDQLKYDISGLENAVNVAKQRNVELRDEIRNLQNVHKSKLAADAEERRSLQRKLEDAKSEQRSLQNLLSAARFEHEATSKLLEKARSKQSGFSAYEDKISDLEAELERLNQELSIANKETELVRRGVDELDELKEQNSHLARCLASMDKSRKQYEEDARRYRAQYEKSEKESDTLRFMLSDIEKHWETYHGNDEEDSEEDAEKKPLAPGFLTEPDGEIDDLTKIVGIGKVFEKTLHDLGVFHFRQIAAFGEEEIRQVNIALKEFNGRMEADDWMGQATALQFKKYGKL